MNTIEPDYIFNLRGCDINDHEAQLLKNEWFIDILDDNSFNSEVYAIPKTKLNKIIIWLFKYKRIWR